MSPRAAWLRLLVAALFCVVGVVRPLAQRSEADAVARANGPLHVSASTREHELAALRKRATDGADDDGTSLEEVRPDLFALACGGVELAAMHDAPPASASLERPCARGPPVA